MIMKILILTLFLVSLKVLYNLYYFWTAAINSNVMTAIFKHMFKLLSLQGGYLRIGAPQIKELPLPKTSTEVKAKIIRLCKKYLDLVQVSFKIEKDSNKWISIKDEIEKLDKKIDEEVYKLYGLSPEEIAIVEGGGKNG